MKIDNKLSDKIVGEIAKQNIYKCLLLYGEDESTVESRYRHAIELFKKKSYEVLNIAPEILKNNPTFLEEEFFSISMFAADTLYTIKLLDSENSYTKFFENLFDKNDLSNNNNFLIITCGALEVTSSLRKFAEKSKTVACIACYEKTSRDISIFINNILKKYNFKYNNDVVNYLLDILGNNSLIIENEIFKLDLYKSEDRVLTLEDVKNCITDASKYDLSEFCDAFCNLNKALTVKIADKMFNENLEIVVLIRTLVRYFLQLQKIVFMISNGDNIENIFKIEKIFWKQQSSIKSHLKIWNLKSINAMLRKLITLEKSTKFDQNGKTIFRNFIMS